MVRMSTQGRWVAASIIAEWIKCSGIRNVGDRNFFRYVEPKVLDTISLSGLGYLSRCWVLGTG